jgi:cytoskeletal protein CcmA (bactofilin family)
MAGTIVEQGFLIDGEITSEEEVVVQGQVHGKLTTTDAVSIGATGAVEAEVRANTISVAGRIVGNVSAAERVDLQAGGKLTGDVKSARFTIADGATFKGNVDMDT